MGGSAGKQMTSGEQQISTSSTPSTPSTPSPSGESVVPVTGEMFVQTELGNKLPRNNYRRHHHPVLDFAMAAAAAACAVLLSNPVCW